MLWAIVGASCLARFRVQKVCGDVPHSQGNVCALFVQAKPRIKHSACSRTAVVQPYLSACFGPSSGQFDGIISFLARVRVRKVCGDVPRTQGNVCAPSVHAKPRIKHSACSRTAVVQPYLSACFGPSSGQFDGIISCLARVRVRKVCGDVTHTRERLCIVPRIRLHDLALENVSRALKKFFLEFH